MALDRASVGLLMLEASARFAWLSILLSMMKSIIKSFYLTFLINDLMI